MPLSNGSHLGPYEVLHPLGAGGMGEVYRARDTRLDRNVAIKVLPEHLASDPTRKRRFEREAQAVASLSHPHICALYDVGRENNTDFLVMEYLEGKTLAERLKDGPLPPEQTLRFAVEIADALDKAHRSGVIHRDLKPENVMITRNGTKLLDFGLAKPSASSHSPPRTSLTQQGLIVGTVPFMAPEQLKGNEADARSDIHAFGAILYEMATGMRAFEGESQASLIGSIMETEPPAPSSLNPQLPPALDRVVKICLEKDPDDRWQTAHDLKLQLVWIAENRSGADLTPAATRPSDRVRERASWAAVVALCVVVLALGDILLRRPAERPETMRFALTLPENAILLNWPVISPDGKRVVFAATQGDKSPLWVRSLNSVTAQMLPGTDGAVYPFWSPDSRWIAFFDPGGKLRKISAEGGPVQTICETRDPKGGTWRHDGSIIFAPDNQGGLWEVPAGGGPLRPFTAPDSSRAEAEHEWPQTLDDGRVIYFAISSKSEFQGTYIVDAGGRQPRLILAGASVARYAQNHLLFLRQNILMAQPFDPGPLHLSGEALPLADSISSRSFSGPIGLVFFSVAERGALVFRNGITNLKLQLTWLDRNGKPSGLVGEPAEYTNPSLSPDGRQVAVGRVDPDIRTRDLWIMDSVRGTSTRFTSDKADDLNPIWSRDGSKVVFSSTRRTGKTNDIYIQTVNGLGSAELIYANPDYSSYVNDWSADGRYVLIDTAQDEGIWALPLFGKRQPFLVAKARAARFSPDGKWVSFHSEESGRYEIYVQSFPKPTARWQVSNNGGRDSSWRGDGREMYYLEGTKMMAVDVNANASQFEAGIPKALFDSHVPAPSGKNSYAVTSDGQRFLVLSTPAEFNVIPMVVVLNWAEGLGK